MDKTWEDLLCQARQMVKPHTVSRMMQIGRVASALITKKGTIYTGICIETKCSLGMCAEKNAISNMLANGEFDIERICTINDEGFIMPPCGACREYMIQLGSSAKNIKVLVDNNGNYVELRELLPIYPYI